MTNPEDRLESIDCKDFMAKHFFAFTAVAFMNKMSQSAAVSYNYSIFSECPDEEEGEEDGVLPILE